MVDLEAYPTPIISMYRTQVQLDVVDMTQAWLFLTKIPYNIKINAPRLKAGQRK